MIGLVAIAAATMLVAIAIVAPTSGQSRAGLAATFLAHRRLRRARRDGDASLVSALEAMLAGARAGLVLSDALALARDRARGDLAERLATAVTNEALGVALGDALAAVRAGASSTVDALLGDLELCARARLPSERVAALAEDELSTMRFARELTSDVGARTAGQRFQVWLLAAIVPALALYLAVMSPTLADELRSPLGRYVFIPGGLLFEVAGIMLSRRVVEQACR